MASIVMRNDSLTVTLLSSASTDLYPANKNNSFVNQFPTQLSLDPAYRVVLQDIHYHPLQRRSVNKGERLQPAILAPSDNGRPRILCCYCNIIQPVMIGSHYAPLLAILPLGTPNTHCVTEPLPHKLVVHRFSEIAIQLTDGDGYGFPLSGGIVVTLQFSRL